MRIGARAALSVCVTAVSVAVEAQEIAVSGLGRIRATFDEPFSSVRSLREEPDGRVLVLDDIENRIVRVDLRAGTATVIGRQGNGPGEYTLPIGLLERAAGPPPPYATVDQWAVAADGCVAIVTVDPYRVVFIDRSGGRIESPVLQYRPVPMSAGLKAEWRVRQEQPVRSLRMDEDRTMSPGRARRTYVEPSEWPEVLPPFLQRALRFAPDGIYTVRRDADDLEYLHLHQLQP